jgi:hypothetical protein
MNKFDGVSVQVVRGLIKSVPKISFYLEGRARFILHALILKRTEYKTVEFFQGTLERLVNSVYENNLSGEFIDIMASLIQGQIAQAYEQAWTDAGNDLPLPDYLASAAEDMILAEFDHVDEFYRYIVDLRIDEKPIDSALSRVPLWANRWNDAYNNANLLVTAKEGGNLVWVYGDTDHCPECQQLNGIVARASEWEQLDVHPQQPENDKLTCGGWRCGCSLEPTDQRRSPKAFETILNIVSK